MFYKFVEKPLELDDIALEAYLYSVYEDHGFEYLLTALSEGMTKETKDLLEDMSYWDGELQDNKDKLLGLLIKQRDNKQTNA
jgi:hypothetical protein